MRARREFAYAQARLQARHGGRPTEADWRVLDGTRSAAQHLERARSVLPRRWSEGLDATLTSHAIEAALRRVGEATVAEVAGWVPAAWRPAVRWMALLPVLPLVAGALADDVLPPWAEDEPWLEPLRDLDPAARRIALATTAAAPLVAAPVGTDLGRAWLDHWTSLWPGRAAGDVDLDDLAEAVVGLFAAPRRGGIGGAPTVAGRGYERSLQRHFRRGAGGPAAAFAHVGLTLVDLERFRGGLVRRSLFAGGSAEEAA